MTHPDKGDQVEWDWGDGTGTGKVRKTWTEKVTRTIKSTEVTRNGTQDDPALLIEQDDGDEVLKLSSEVRRV
jgi:hypothetical protein